MLYIFDVDRTLVTTKSGHTFRNTADDWQWIPGRREKLLELDKQGHKLACATNQGGVAFGYLNALELRHELNRMAKEGHITFLQMCFTHPNASIEEYHVDSLRRKPGPNMLYSILAHSGEEPTNTVVVGNRDEDLQAARAAGLTFIHADIFFQEDTP